MPVSPLSGLSAATGSSPCILRQTRVWKNHSINSGPLTPSGFCKSWFGPAPYPSIESAKLCTRTFDIYSSLSAAVWPSNDLQVVSVRVFKIKAASIIVLVDLVFLPVIRVSPEGKLTFAYAAEDFVESHFAYEKGVVRPQEIVLGLNEVESNFIVELYSQEKSKLGRLRKSQDVGQKIGGNFLVSRVNDQMVKFDAHRVWSNSL